MRIVRAPVRITLGGGGTDLPGYYTKYGGFLISAAINKFIYITGSKRPFDNKFWLSYSNLEVCEDKDEIKHELLRKCLEKYSFKTGIEIHSISELPGNTGLGSSGSFLVALLTLINSLSKIEVSRKEVAEMACRIEIEELGHSCGKQDQYIAAFGGIISLEIDKQGNVDVRDLDLDRGVLKELQNNLRIYYTGFMREAESILKQQKKGLEEGRESMVSNLKKIKEIGNESGKCLQNNNLNGFGTLLDEHWHLKKAMDTNMSNSLIDEIYDKAKASGCLGGKLMGAGGGGFFMFYVPPENKRKFEEGMQSFQLAELDWRFNFNGCEIIYADSQ